MLNEQLINCLKNLTDSGMRELYLLQTDEAVQDYWKQRNQVLQEMNSEIQQAVSDIRSRYEGTLFDLEQDYAMYLSMITPMRKEQDS